MPFQVSPSVLVTERDLTNVIPAVSTSIGAAVIAATWGPVNDATLIADENALVSTFGIPIRNFASDWFNAANFLSYSGAVQVVRHSTPNMSNAFALGGVSASRVSSIQIASAGAGYSSDASVVISAPDAISPAVLGTVTVSSGGVTSVAVTSQGAGYTVAPAVTVTGTGTGASLVANVVAGRVVSISVVSAGTGYTVAPVVTIAAPVADQATASLTLDGSGSITSITMVNEGSGYAVAPTVTIASTSGPTTAASLVAILSDVKLTIENDKQYQNTFLGMDNSKWGSWAARYPGAKGNSIGVSMADAGNFDIWTKFKSLFDAKPATSEFAIAKAESIGLLNKNLLDELHVVVYNKDTGEVLEVYPFLSKMAGAKTSDGASAYYADVINTRSKWVYWMSHTTAVSATGTAWGSYGETMSLLPFKTLSGSVDVHLADGSDGDFSGSVDSNKIAAFDQFLDETMDINLVMCGDSSATVARYVIENIAEVRRDCVAFVSPNKAGKPIIGSTSVEMADIIAFRTALGVSSSFGVMDGAGYKYQYDKYWDTYRWVPLNGDIAGLCARTDYTNDPWFSPAGFNRGQVKNVVRLAFNAGNVAIRDELYKVGINPVVSFQGQGTVLYGDKTLLSRPSAFDRINVRRLFLVLEKAISTAAKYQLFELNDAFTRAQFKNMVEPFLRDVKGRRGLYDFLVVADESNNTPEVIDGNRFVGDIFLKPAKSINFIQLNFVATRTGASFSELTGASGQ